MVDSLVKSLGSLARERQALQRKEQQLAQRQQQLIKDLDQLLHGIGYQLTPLGNGKGLATSPNGLVKKQARKHLKCPKCDRRFAHRLPLARHFSASHQAGQRKAKKVTRRRARKTA
jgi:uncharacterized C2H2 Zn-finger protein